MKNKTAANPPKSNHNTHFLAGFAIGGLFISAIWKGFWWLELLTLAALLAYFFFNRGFTRRYFNFRNRH
jgi:hypothetical protein